MFNFTTLTVVNSINTSGKDKNYFYTANKSLVLNGVQFTKARGVTFEVYKNVHKTESPAHVTFTLPSDMQSGDTYQFDLYIGLSMHCQDPLYSNDLVYKGRPFSFEFDGGATVSEIVKRAKYVLNIGEPMLEVSSTDAVEADAGNNIEAAAATITFTAKNGFQIIKKAILNKWDPEAKPIDCCSKEGAWAPQITAVPEKGYVEGTGWTTNPDYVDDATTPKIIAGQEAFGNYDWMIANLRLPTYENSNPWSMTKKEQPIPGVAYDQYIVKMIIDRDGIAGNAVGQRVTSVTTHVFYINAADANVSTFVSNLTALTGATVKENRISDSNKGPYNDTIV